MTKVDLIQANNDDFLSIYGYVPENPYVAFKCFIDEIFTGIGGYVYTENRATFFLNVFDKKRYFIIFKVLLRKINELKNNNLQFNVIRDKNEPTSEKLLQKLGFSLQYVVDDDEIWVLDENCKL